MSSKVLYLQIENYSTRIVSPSLRPKSIIFGMSAPSRKWRVSSSSIMSIFSTLLYPSYCSPTSPHAKLSTKPSWYPKSTKQTNRSHWCTSTTAAFLGIIFILRNKTTSSLLFCWYTKKMWIFEVLFMKLWIARIYNPANGYWKSNRVEFWGFMRISSKLWERLPKKMKK